MNPHARLPSGPASLVASLLAHRELIAQMARREVAARYRGSVLGVLWALLTPLLMLSLYTFVFSVVFEARWGADASAGRSRFAVFAFVGMLVHGLLAESMVRAPSLVLANPSFVKKVVFPLEILPVVALSASLFHAAAGFGVLAVAQLALDGALPWTWVFLPLTLLPVVLFALGVSWFLASTGVYLRDIAHPVGLAATVLLFASPVFFPASSVPQPWRDWVLLNPLSLVIEQTRAVLLQGRAPDAAVLAAQLGVGALVAWLGYFWFQRIRKGFANVV